MPFTFWRTLHCDRKLPDVRTRAGFRTGRRGVGPGPTRINCPEIQGFLRFAPGFSTQFFVAEAAKPLEFQAFRIRVGRGLRAEEALRASEGRFRGLMEQAPFSVQVFDASGRTIRVNRAWEELWGVTLDQV